MNDQPTQHQTTDICEELRSTELRLLNRAADEIEMLRIRLMKIAHAPAPQSNALAQTLKAWAMPREGEYPYA